MKKLKNEKGSITIYVIITMLFFSVFIMSIYIINSRKFATQLEANADVKSIYEKDGAEKTYVSHFAADDEEIPIYTREQLLSIGSEDRIYVAQEKKIYKFTKEPDKYVLKNNITNLTSQDVSSLSTKLLYVKNNNEYKLKNNYLIKIK